MPDPPFGYRPPRIRLLDEELHLDPDILRIMQEIEGQMLGRQLITTFLQPNWQLNMSIWQSILNDAPRQNPMLYTLPRTPGQSTAPTPPAGPLTSRPGELSDVMRAVYLTQPAQRAISLAHDEGMRQLGLLRREWEQAPTGDRVIMVTMTGIVLGTMVTTIVANQPTRDLAFSLIKGRDIPVPGVDGLSFQILDRGGSVTAPLGVPGLSGTARLQFPGAPTRPDYEIGVSFDVMEFIRSRR